MTAPAPTWTPVDSATAPGLSATIDDHTVFVSTFDEGPTRPAFYWQIDDRRGLYRGQWFDGWSRSPAQAKRDAVRQVQEIDRNPS